VVRLDCLTNISKGHPPWSVAVYEVDEAAAEQDISVQMPLAYLDGAPDGDEEMQAWREPPNLITAQTYYAFTGVDHPGPSGLDFNNTRRALQACGMHFCGAPKATRSTSTVRLIPAECGLFCHPL
jgi:hypothetical protein